MPAHEVSLTQDMRDPMLYCAQCNDGHPFVELYRGVARSGMLQAIAMHNASVHKISRFPKTST